MLINRIFKLYRELNISAVGSTDERTKMPYEEQLKYLNSFRDPKDDFERSYFKYKCFCKYCYYKRTGMLILYNIGSMFALPFLYLKLSKKNQTKLADNNHEKVDAVVLNVPWLPNEDFIPDEINDKYKKIIEIKSVINPLNTNLSSEAIKIYKEQRKRYFFRFYYRIITMLKLAQFSTYLDLYKPDAIAYYSCEREFAGPLQSLLCENCGAQFLAFMHGDYLSTLSFSFLRYSHYYVWDDYTEMFKRLKCVAPMTVYTPRKFRGSCESVQVKQCSYFATYYLSDETEEEVRIINCIFSEFEDYGLRTKVRPHPRSSNIDLLNQIFKKVLIEDPNVKGLKDSISESIFCVGMNTTVLSEAYYSGKTVVIDNLSNVEKYNHLDERGYIAIKRPHILLSDLRNGLFKKYDNQYACFKS